MPGRLDWVVKLTILPGISDRPEQLAEVVKTARTAGATGVWTSLLFLRPGTREHFSSILPRTGPSAATGLGASHASLAFPIA